MQQPEAGSFIISLDFELLWGVRDKKTIETYGANIRGVREVIPRLLETFDQYGIHATFATVGFLFAQNKAELLHHLPSVLPEYSQKKYSPYEDNYFSTIGESERTDIYHYGASLIKMIQEHPTQEIATHTFSHYYCLEGASMASFEADLAAAKKMAQLYHIDLKSIVFPRNQYSRQHISICKQQGIIAYRGNEKATIYHPRKNEDQNKTIRAVRLLDSYINLTGHNTCELTRESNDGIVNLPSSRFLRPYSKSLRLLDPLRLRRINKSLSYAAQHKEVYHLWWHPHNFGVHLKENLYFLEQVLQHYRHLNEKYGFRSRSMKEMAEEMAITHAV